jgi:UDP-glucose:(heptosyl)LPS alpha-1,3-glucosyltransferase
MQLAFALFHYFPYGGLERDMLAIARTCVARGHAVTIYTGSWQGEKPGDVAVTELGISGWSNHARNASFAERLLDVLAERPVDAVIGFNKMPGLDVYYAADVCFAQKAFEERNVFYRLTPRSRHYLGMEQSVFGGGVKGGSRTQVLMISQPQMAIYQRYWQTPSERLHLLPPGIRRERVMPNDYAQQRVALRQHYAIADDEFLLLMVGSDFRRKGLDRSIRGLAALPEALRKRCHLWVAGQDKEAPFRQLALTLGVADQVNILGGRDDVSQLLWAADALLHPAYSENTGTALLEGMVAGLPVIATDVCGYAPYIEDWQMGEVLSDPVTPASMAAALEKVLATEPGLWRERAQAFVDTADIFSMPQRAAEAIEQFAARRQPEPSP